MQLRRRSHPVIDASHWQGLLFTLGRIKLKNLHLHTRRLGPDWGFECELVARIAPK